MLWLLWAALGHSGGSPQCAKVNALMWGYTTENNNLAMACVNGLCTVTASVDIRGILVYRETGEWGAQTEPGLRPLLEKCLTHSERLNRKTVSFVTESTTEVQLIVVYRNNGGSGDHVVQTLTQYVTVLNTDVHIHVVGAGPGGTSAARWLHEQSVPFTVYEKGTYDPTLFQVPIKNTAPTCGYNVQACFLFPTYLYSVNNKPLYMGVGGNQNHNGAVYKPGTAEDLSRSIGVSLTAATAAQDIAANYVVHTDYDMMWSCIDAGDCDSATLNIANEKMARRSVAFDLQDDILANFNLDSPVQSVTSNAITLENDTVITLGPNDRVIVAAGALTTPKLLGYNEFTAWNHYYVIGDSITNGIFFDKLNERGTQYFEYHGDYEFNYAKIGAEWMNISMQMTPTARERYVNNEGMELIGGYVDNYIGDSWHYAGTVPHSFMRHRDSNIFIGDTSALQEPFNCHTSMPAAAAGILAAQAATDVLPRDVDQPVLTTKKVDMPIAAVFLVGSILIVVGVAAHVLKYYKAHYVIMGVAVITLLIAAVIARGKRPDAHATVGWILIGLLCVQAAAGTYLAAKPNRAYGVYHRASGWLILGVLIAALYTAVTHSTTWHHGEVYEGFAGVTAGGTAVVLIFSVLITEKVVTLKDFNLEALL